MDNLLSALDYISPDIPRNDWYRILAGIKHELGDAGKDAAEDWSRKDKENYKEADFLTTWNSLQPNHGITGGTVIHYARASGWKPDQPNHLVDEAARLKRKNQIVIETKQAAAEKQQLNEAAALTAIQRWEAASAPDPKHKYLVTKDINPIDIRQEGDNLLLPMRDADGNLAGLQTISPDGKKLFQKGSGISGAYMLLKGSTDIHVVCEGYATGNSILDATDHNVAVAYSCGNLIHVARIIREKLPEGDIIIAGDADPPATADKAREVARAINARVAIPESGDFNDMAVAGGDVKSAINAAQIVPDIEVVSDIEWSDPEPLPRALVAVDAFNDLWLPESIRPWVSDISERIQCPPDFPAVGAMVSLANTLGRKIAIRPKKYDDWMEVPNLWGGIVGRPGIMKSPALSESMRPMHRLAMEAQNKHKEAVDTADSGEEIRAAQIKALRSKLIKACAGKGTVIAEDIAGEMEALKKGDEVDPCRRYTVNDATVEKLGELLADNPEGLMIYRDELVGWLRALDKEGSENTRPFFLESWNGMGSYTYDRIGRGTLHIEHACLGVLGGIQPGPLSVYVRGAIKNGQGADGLLQRIQMLVWPDEGSQWKDVDRYPNSAARDTAFNVFQYLAELKPEAVDAQLSEYSPQPWLRFDDSAQEIFTEWRNDLENTKLRSGEHEVIESHLSKYRKLIPALALVIHLADNGTGPVTKQALVKACAWGEYLESHARRVYSVGIAPDLGAAHALLGKIKQGRLSSPFKPSEVYHKGWAGLNKEDTYKAIDILSEYNWIGVDHVKTGGRPSILCHLNPVLLP